MHANRKIYREALANGSMSVLVSDSQAGSGLLSEVVSHWCSFMKCVTVRLLSMT